MISLVMVVGRIRGIVVFMISLVVVVGRIQGDVTMS